VNRIFVGQLFTFGTFLKVEYACKNVFFPTVPKIFCVNFDKTCNLDTSVLSRPSYVCKA
jgi:hypothetical protein